MCAMTEYQIVQIGVGFKVAIDSPASSSGLRLGLDQRLMRKLGSKRIGRLPGSTRFRPRLRLSGCGRADPQAARALCRPNSKSTVRAHNLWITRLQIA